MIIRRKSKNRNLPVEPHPSESNIILELIQYNDKVYQKHDDLPVTELLALCKPGHVSWINLDGLHDRTLIQKIGEHFQLHSLLIEDINSDNQPKAEEYKDYLFFTLKMLYRIEAPNIIDYEQISFVLGKDYLLSFQEKDGDLFGPFRERIRLNQGRVRKKKADYLLYRLIDIIVDSYYTILDNIGQQIEDIEEAVYNNPTSREFQHIQQLKKELIYLRKALYPLRDALNKLIKDESGFIESSNTRYFSDIYDHVVHLIDSLDTYKDLTSGLMDIHINTLNTRMNEIIKVLTIASTIFMPLTFIVGVYGMNFKYMPELHSSWGYPAVWAFMTLMTVGMVMYFKHKKWF
jgi:magnesium transporter